LEVEIELKASIRGDLTLSLFAWETEGSWRAMGEQAMMEWSTQSRFPSGTWVGTC
jgi:hypothetical protein